jgi:hypothetical protein
MKRQAIAFVFGALFLCGCSGSKEKTPPTAKISGTVLLDGSSMPNGEVIFTTPGQPPKTLEVTGGNFSGEVYAGKNLVEVNCPVDAPNPMDPKGPPVKKNKVASTYQGPSSPLSADVPEGGKTDLKFEVKSGRK